MNKKETLNHVERGYRMPQPYMCPDDVYKIMKRCWDANPENRPTFEHLFNYFDDYECVKESGYLEPLDSTSIHHLLELLKLKSI